MLDVLDLTIGPARFHARLLIGSGEPRPDVITDQACLLPPRRKDSLTAMRGDRKIRPSNYELAPESTRPCPSQDRMLSPALWSAPPDHVAPSLCWHTRRRSRPDRLLAARQQQGHRTRLRGRGMRLDLENRRSVPRPARLSDRRGSFSGYSRDRVSLQL